MAGEEFSNIAESSHMSRVAAEVIAGTKFAKPSLLSFLKSAGMRGLTQRAWAHTDEHACSANLRLPGAQHTCSWYCEAGIPSPPKLRQPAEA